MKCGWTYLIGLFQGRKGQVWLIFHIIIYIKKSCSHLLLPVASQDDPSAVLKFDWCRVIFKVIMKIYEDQ